MAGGIRPSPPARLSAPAAGIDAAVVSVRERDGELEVPPVDQVGWYSGGPRPGEPGRAVLLGHVDSKKGNAVFWALGSLKPGALLTLTDGTGGLHRFTVTSVTRSTKTAFPRERVYGLASGPELALVTCGGPLVEGAGYRDNVIVFARAA